MMNIPGQNSSKITDNSISGPSKKPWDSYSQKQNLKNSPFRQFSTFFNSDWSFEMLATRSIWICPNRVIWRIFRGRVFDVYVILTSLASITQNFAKNFRILFPAFFCIPIAVICKKFQVSSFNGATEDNFLSEKSQNSTYFS